ncbi:MAG: adenosyl-hopene transferase HpnH [Pseudomonadota bacterium]
MRFPLKQTLKVKNYISQQKKAGIKRFPLVLMLEPLFACNFSCSGCGRIKEYKGDMQKRLNLEASLKAVDECKAPVISVCGGEPLIYREIGELVEALLAKGKVTYLCTNGWSLKEKIDLFEPHPLFNINIHLDGLSKTHDAIVEKKGAFDRAIDGILAAKERGFTVCTNTTIYKQTDIKEIVALFDMLEQVNVDGFLVSPGFDYQDVGNNDFFLTREEIKQKFQELKEYKVSKRIWSTPMFLDYLMGKREYNCTAWGNVTYNVRGWKAPCYLITDEHHPTYDSFINETPWDSYGHKNDKRCHNCMAHCGIEPTVALTVTNSIIDTMKIAWWTIF